MYVGGRSSETGDLMKSSSWSPRVECVDGSMTETARLMRTTHVALSVTDGMLSVSSVITLTELLVWLTAPPWTQHKSHTHTHSDVIAASLPCSLRSMWTYHSDNWMMATQQQQQQQQRSCPFSCYAHWQYLDQSPLANNTVILLSWRVAYFHRNLQFAFCRYFGSVAVGFQTMTELYCRRFPDNRHVILWRSSELWLWLCLTLLVVLVVFLTLHHLNLFVYNNNNNNNNTGLEPDMHRHYRLPNTRS